MAPVWYVIAAPQRTPDFHQMLDVRNLHVQKNAPETTDAGNKREFVACCSGREVEVQRKTHISTERVFLGRQRVLHSSEKLHSSDVASGALFCWDGGG